MAWFRTECSPTTLLSMKKLHSFYLMSLVTKTLAVGLVLKWGQPNRSTFGAGMSSVAASLGEEASIY